jgi:hypothetical protein
VAETPGADEQELLEELQAELAKLRVSDLLLQTLYSVSSLAYHRLSTEARDLDQARLGIEALRALMAVLEGEVPEEALRDFNQVLANLQFAYASAVAEGSQG